MPNAFVPYLKLFRFPLVFTAVADSAAGYLAIQCHNPDAGVLALLAVSSAGLYFLGMGLNDIVDQKRDQVLAPQRVLPSGRITRVAAAVACGVAVTGSIVALAIIPDRGATRFLVWGGTLICIVAYDTLLKFPPVMGLVRAGNFLLGASCVRMHDLFGWEYPGPSPYACAFAPLIYGTFLTYVSTLEEGGPRKGLVRMGAAGMTLAALVPMAVRWHSGPSPFSEWGALPSGLLMAWTWFRALRATDRKGIMLFVRDGVAGFILLDSAQLAWAGKLAPAAAIAGLLLPAALSVAWFKKLA